MEQASGRVLAENLVTNSLAEQLKVVDSLSNHRAKCLAENLVTNSLAEQLKVVRSLSNHRASVSHEH